MLNNKKLEGIEWHCVEFCDKEVKMMGLSNCPECGKVYVENPARLCPACYEQEEKDADAVAEFVRDHPRSHINEVHEATGVKHKVILRMLKKGRITGAVTLAYPCESCSAPITEGRLCLACSNNILSQIKPEEVKKQETVKKADPEKRSGMFTTRF